MIHRSLGASLLVVLLLASSLAGLGGSTHAASWPHAEAGQTDLKATERPANSDPFGLALGDEVQVIASALNCRATPSTSGTLISTEPSGQDGMIDNGSVNATGYIWWYIAYTDGNTGWSAEGTGGTAWLENITSGGTNGTSVPYDRAAALAYAAKYWNVVTSDGYFWDGTDSYEALAQGTSVVGLSGDDCAHFVSQAIGNEPHQAGGGLNIPSRVPPTYGEPGAGNLGDLLISNGWAVQVSSVSQLMPGDVINYEWTAGAGWEHVALYLGNGTVAAHTDSNYGANWTLGGAVAYRFIHILNDTAPGGGVNTTGGTHPAVGVTLNTNNGSAPLSVTATVRATGGTGTYTAYTYLWGDGTQNVSSSGTATHVYTAPGIDSLDVEVRDSSGYVGWSSNFTITVRGLPLAVGLASNVSRGTAPLTVAFTASPSGGSGLYGPYLWQFGNGAVATTAVPSADYTYPSVGTYLATVTVYDNLTGATASSSSASITTLPAAGPLSVTLAPSVDEGIAPATVTFEATAAGGTSDYASYGWNFGDGTSSTTTTATVSHTFSAAGTMTVTVTVTDSGGATATSPAVTLTIGNPLVSHVAASLTSGAAPLSVTFTLTISGGDAPYSVAWSFGDGSDVPAETSSASSVVLSHIYAQAGTPTVTVSVSDARGVYANATVGLTVSAAPSGSGGTGSGTSSGGSWLSSPDVALGVLGALALVAVVAAAVALRRRAPPPTSGEPEPPVDD